MTDDSCPECDRESLAVELYDDGSGRVYCKETDCDFSDKFYQGEGGWSD